MFGESIPAKLGNVFIKKGIVPLMPLPKLHWVFLLKRIQNNSECKVDKRHDVQRRHQKKS